MGVDTFKIIYEPVGESTIGALIMSIGYLTELGFYYVDEGVIDELLETVSLEEIYNDFRSYYKQLTGYESDKSFEEFRQLLDWFRSHDEFMGYDYTIIR